MVTSATTPPELSDIQLYGLAEDLLDALLSAADVEVIGRERWWERAKTALETGAASSDSFRQCVARASRKLQIEAPNDGLSKTTARLAQKLDDPDVYARWAELSERDSLVITALVRDRRTTRDAKRKAAEKTQQKAPQKSPALPEPAGKKTNKEESECLPF